MQPPPTNKGSCVEAGETTDTLAAAAVVAVAAVVGDGDTTTVPLQADSATATSAMNTMRPADAMTRLPDR